ncbi:MAG: hypothetical protein KBS68_01470 [Clostridiales bacterium]|nr:hypothetical protein [Candidatus Crickella merdequi]
MIVEAGLAIIGLLLLNVFDDIMANKMTNRVICFTIVVSIVQIVMTGICNYFIGLAEIESVNENRIIEVFDLVTPYVIIPTIVIVGPILEELIFRKILISWLNFALEGKITKNNAC